MQVKVAKRLYTMTRRQFDGLLKVAGEQVPFGIYAVEKNGYAELLNLRCESRGDLKRHKHAYRNRGFKVYANGG